MPVNNAPTTSTEVKNKDPQTRKSAIKNIVLVPYKPKPKDWGSWKVKSPYVTSIIASPSAKQNQNNEEMVYVLHSPYYSSVHPLMFYEDE